MRWLASILLAATALAGCATAPADEPAAVLPGEISAFGLSPDATYPFQDEGFEATQTGGAMLQQGQRLDWSGTCPCDDMWFTAAPWSEPVPGWIEVRVTWDGTKVADLGLSVTDSLGNHAVGERGFDDRVARLFVLANGPMIVHINGTGGFSAVAHYGTTFAKGSGALLPNLVEEVPSQPALGACDEVETAEQGATKCLRFGNGVANPGHGSMQIRLTVDQAATALASAGGHFSQEVRMADGSMQSHDVGPASFHVTHGHWHYDGLALFELYAVDATTSLRGALATSHGKSGFCFLDWDQMTENTTVPAEQERAESDCLIPTPRDFGAAGFPLSWTNGISVGWYDFYVAGLTDQYVDVADVAPGLYELVMTADPLDTLEELDETDNRSSLLLEWDGTRAKALEPRGHYHTQPVDGGL